MVVVVVVGGVLNRYKRAFLLGGGLYIAKMKVKGLKKVCFQTQILGNLFKYIYFCSTLLFT